MMTSASTEKPEKNVSKSLHPTTNSPETGSQEDPGNVRQKESASLASNESNTKAKEKELKTMESAKPKESELKPNESTTRVKDNKSHPKESTTNLKDFVTIAKEENSVSQQADSKPEKTHISNVREEVPVELINKTVDKQYRKKKLVRKSRGTSIVKYALWVGGHSTSVVFGVIYLVWNASLLANIFFLKSIAYRISLLGALVAFMVTVSRRFGLSHLPRFSMMLAQKNFQFLLLASVWLITFRSVFKILPTILVSLLQLAQEKETSAVLQYADRLGSVIAFSEIVLVVYLAVRTMLMMKTAGYQLLLVLTLLWLRVLFDKETAQIFAYVANLLDGKVSSMKNRKVKKAWVRLRVFLMEKVENHSSNNQVNSID